MFHQNMTHAGNHAVPQSSALADLALVRSSSTLDEIELSFETNENKNTLNSNHYYLQIGTELCARQKKHSLNKNLRGTKYTTNLPPDTERRTKKMKVQT
jgi:hypothetical protein